MRSKYISPEPLESRIAPAFFFLNLSGVMLAKGGALMPSVALDAVEAGSASAYHFKAGDSVIGDLNNDGIWQKSEESLLLRVMKGAAIAFFAAPAGDIPVMTGLAVGDGFSGAASLEGTVATLVDAMGNFTPSEWQHARIAKLILKGGPGGDLLAGSGIKNVTVLPADERLSNTSIDSVRVGSAVDGVLLSLNGGRKVLDPHFTAPIEKTDGADIKNLRLPYGANEVIAGDGFLGGRGGDLSGITFAQLPDELDLIAGNGSEGIGVGGRGGNVSEINMKSLTDVLTISAGDGADGQGGKRGGAGGKVSAVRAASSPDGGGVTLNITGGAGGDGSYDSMAVVRGKTKALWSGGGAGGHIRGILIDAPQTFSSISLTGGDGGEGAFRAKAGAGGDVSAVKVAKVVRPLSGLGLASVGLDGVGTGTSTLSIAVNMFTVSAGNGGSGDSAGAVADVASAGGRGGDVSRLNFIGPVGMLTLKAGVGGDGDGRGVGAHGGDVRGVFGVLIRQVGFRAGDGGDGVSGGAGGNIFSAKFAHANFLVAQAGTGGAGSELAGGDGGELRDIRGKLDDSPSLFGGVGGIGITRGGEGGEVSHIVFSVSGSGNGMGGVIAAADGGDAGAGGIAGSGGALRDIRIFVKGALTQLPIFAGNGGNAGDVEGKAGAGGVIAGLLLNIENGDIQVAAGNAGMVGRNAAGGGIGVSIFRAGSGGQVTLISGSGTNGDPGQIGPSVFVNGRPFV